MTTVVQDRFETIKTLGSGFSATTKLARDIETGEQVALKIFDLDKGDINTKMLNLLQNEYNQCKDFAHENIVKYHGFSYDTVEVK